jgi:hypothetical protein
MECSVGVLIEPVPECSFLLSMTIGIVVPPVPVPSSVPIGAFTPSSIIREEDDPWALFLPVYNLTIFEWHKFRVHAICVVRLMRIHASPEVSRAGVDEDGVITYMNACTASRMVSTPAHSSPSPSNIKEYGPSNPVARAATKLRSNSVRSIVPLFR